MMTAILTDIHANREAFEACLAHAERQGASRHVLLGDFVGYGADPGWVVDRVMALVAEGATAVIGNHDLAAIGMLPTPMSGAAERAVNWTRAQLDPAQIAFLAGLPLKVEDDPNLYVHANAWDPDGFEYVEGIVEAGRSMRATRSRITFCGHVHQPAIYHMGLNQRVEHFRPIPGSALPLSAARRWLVLPGSCGQPRDGNPAACYALFDEVGAMLTTHRVPYDHPAAAAKVRAAGFAAPGDLSALGR